MEGNISFEKTKGKPKLPFSDARSSNEECAKI